MNDQPDQAQNTPPAVSPDGPHADEPSLHGARLACDDDQARNQAIEQAFDYRGDVTVVIRGGEQVVGYIYDRVLDDAGPRSRLRLIPADGGTRRTILYADVEAVWFSGRDPAAGKSWQTWVKKYQEKKARGERASIEPEKLD